MDYDGDKWALYFPSYERESGHMPFTGTGVSAVGNQFLFHLMDAYDQLSDLQLKSAIDTDYYYGINPATGQPRVPGSGHGGRRAEQTQALGDHGPRRPWLQCTQELVFGARDTLGPFVVNKGVGLLAMMSGNAFFKGAPRLLLPASMASRP